MQQFLPFLVIGLATGAVYGLAGLGLVLTYNTSGIFNFGYGAVAAIIAFCFYLLHVDHGMPWPIAAAISLVVVAPLVGLGLELLARSLQGVSETTKIVATVGLILIVEAFGTLWHPTYAPIFPHFLPQSTVDLLSVQVTWEQIIIFLFSLAASAALYWFFRWVRLGVVMRGVVDSDELVSMNGDNPVRVRRWAWLIGTVFAGLAGLLLAATQPLDAVTLSTVVFAAFGAAAIGYFTNLPLTFAGGLLIGIAGALADKYSATLSWIGGLPPSLPFVVLFMVLIVMPKRRLTTRRQTAKVQTHQSYRLPFRLQIAVGIVVLVLLAIMPIVQSGYVNVWSNALTDIILFLSLGLLVRRSGQISLCQITFAAVGCAAFGHFAASDGIPWLIALLLAMLVAVPIGALIAIPAVRLSGIFLALATLGFGIVASEMFYSAYYLFGSNPLGISDPRPDVSIWGWNLSSDKGFYYLLLLFAVLIGLLITAIGRGRLGRILEALSDSPLALETSGTTSSVVKVIVFCLTAAIASMAGALTGMLYHFGEGADFSWFNSIYLAVIVLILIGGDPWYAIIGAVAYAVIPGYVHGATATTWLQLLFGLGAVFAGYQSTHAVSTPASVQRFLDRIGGRRPQKDPETQIAESVPVPKPPTVAKLRVIDRNTEVNEALTIQDLSVRFGGVLAVDGVSLAAPSATITGLVGPNGAGKTTIFNVCSGLLRPTSGNVLLNGTDISRMGLAHRARRGLGRTFQRTELFDSLTVRQNIQMGREAAIAGANPIAQTFGLSRDKKVISNLTDEALELTGINEIADVQVGLLPIGQRRLVDLARTLAGPFELLLLDEPSSGLDPHETEAFGTVLKTVVAERGWGILLVEHDMTLVREVCDYVYLLDFGKLIFEGIPEEMHRSELVRAAYLGDLEFAGPGAVDESSLDVDSLQLLESGE